MNRDYFKMVLVVLFVLVSVNLAQSAPGNSILAAQVTSPEKMQKIGSGSYRGRIQTAVDSQTLEQLSYRGFTILLNPLGSLYEVQVYRMVTYGGRRVSSVFSSLYKSSIEYGYKYDASRQRIIQHHFLFPPNSLTGWANPGDFAAMQQFDWGEKYPLRTCSQDTPIHTLEEAGREYLEATCMPDRDTALRFARKFVDYMLSGRGQ